MRLYLVSKQPAEPTCMQEMAHLIGFDQDPVARELAAAKLGEHDREGLAVDIVADNFRCGRPQPMQPARSAWEQIFQQHLLVRVYALSRATAARRIPAK